MLDCILVQLCVPQNDTHFWQYSNGTRVPDVDKREPSDLDVYAERYAGTIGNSTETWRRILHFKRTQPSFAGNYTCLADYRQGTTYKSVEVQVTAGEWCTR